MSIVLRFCGAARTVTGSCFLLKTQATTFLVDCGLFQGAKTLKDLNYRPFPFDPQNVDFVLQTHAHIDHSGLLPKLVKQGFKGWIHATEGTHDLLSFMLPDSGHIQEVEVEQLNLRNAQRGRESVVPIYTQDDAYRTLDQIRAAQYEEWIEVGDGVRSRFWNAGHILGSSSIEIEVATAVPNQRVLRLLFSGDIGPEHKLFHPDPKAPNNFDYVIAESTYGGRRRTRVSPEQRRRILADEVKQALRADSILLIPIFAVERTQELIADLVKLRGAGAIPPVPIILDSPLAIQVTRVFDRHAANLEDVHAGQRMLDQAGVHATLTREESKRINNIKNSAIVLAASGMCEAGRIRHHLKHWLWHPGATVLLVGYQAQGTLGRLLADGASAVTIQGDEIKVKARIRQTDVYSGHADGGELVDWISERMPIKHALYLTHGEDEEMEALKSAIERAGMPPERIICPVLDDEFDLTDAGGSPRRGPIPRRLPPEVIGKPDWHNDLAQFTLALRDALDSAADERGRKAILRRVARALDEGEPDEPPRGKPRGNRKRR
ncbi:MAG: MBL fold metallo-hydrolase [Hyphomicrobiaceae bacterium]